MNGSLPKTIVVGGGIAGLEALMALADLAAERTELTLVAPDPDFHLKPMVVEEPFTSAPAERRELAPVAEDLRAKLVRGAVGEVTTTAAGAMIALPVIDGPLLAGLPHDDAGFIPIDEHARVPGVERVYAAGDATIFPIKQGGLGTQQADAAAEHIAAQLGADVEAAPIHPILRGKLILGGGSLNLRQDLTGGHGEGVASPDYLWWPPYKVSGRYLAAWLAHEPVQAEAEPPSRPLEIEVALPHEWHRDPMALDPYGPLVAE